MAGSLHSVFQAIHQQLVWGDLKRICNWDKSIKAHGLDSCLYVADVPWAKVYQFGKEKLWKAPSLSDTLDPFADGHIVNCHNGPS